MSKNHFAVAAINEEAVFWLNASQETRDRILKAGGGVPCIRDEDRFVAAQRKAQQPQQAASKAQP
ncbi:MAG: hypothetical protein ACK4NR_01910 [Micavibrio sp.]